MKYFYDTEFIDNGHTIELISIGVAAEDGREYYAISNRIQPGGAPGSWVRKHRAAQAAVAVVAAVAFAPPDQVRSWRTSSASTVTSR